MTDDLVRIPAVLTDAELVIQGPAVRAQLIQGLLRLKEIASDQLGVYDDDGRRDPRWAQIFLHTSDRLERLYKLAKVSGEGEETQAPEKVSELMVSVLSSQFDMLEAEARIKDARG